MCSLLHIQFLLWYILKKQKTKILLITSVSSSSSSSSSSPPLRNDSMKIYIHIYTRRETCLWQRKQGWSNGISLEIDAENTFYLLVLMDFGYGKRVGCRNWFRGTGILISLTGGGQLRAFPCKSNASNRLVCADDRLITKKANSTPIARIPSSPRLSAISELRWMCSLLVGTIRRRR